MTFARGTLAGVRLRGRLVVREAQVQRAKAVGGTRLGFSELAAQLAAMRDVARDGIGPAQQGGRGRDRKSTRLNSSHSQQSRMPSSA